MYLRLIENLRKIKPKEQLHVCDGDEYLWTVEMMIGDCNCPKKFPKKKCVDIETWPVGGIHSILHEACEFSFSSSSVISLWRKAKEFNKGKIMLSLLLL